MSKIRGMRRYGFLASSIGFTCTAALVLAPGLPAAAATAGPTSATGPSAVPGSTQSLPLLPLTRDRARGAALGQGLRRTDVHHFSLVGVIWDDPDTELHGSVRIRTRSTATGTWSDWQDVDTHNADHGADPGTTERASGLVHGATAPLWVGESDGVDVRVRVDTGDRDGGAAADPSVTLPSGLRVELVDPGDEPPPQGSQADASHTGELSAEATAASAANARLAPLGATEIPALDRVDTERELLGLRGDEPGLRGDEPGLHDGELAEQRRAEPYIGPRPRIVTRRGWGADESLRGRGFVYSKKVEAAFVHHTSSGNNYTCAQAPSVIRSIYRYHVKSMGWRDIGYNFLIDKCGTLYEGRAGGVAKAVLGAHTLGFNTDSVGIAVIGSYGTSKPSSAAVTAVARLTAWKLGLYGMNPSGKTYLTSGGGNLYQKGKRVRLNVISGHRDGFSTDCPGRQLYGKLGTARSSAARYQGR
ncbi:N-acetylmuramoyl-L-alanine amidase [Streptomyces sp. NTH33]|uniref:peptidoglycan recognition protein family protein n=1 Tax=Streptomyces sp. NTH33 TaxID=1735453 RepID=UPI000DA951C8|nr:peptidoglycan recognition protein [Streptomyces sp. NTH33]PZH15772.1 N-acetylmuramoyl-L-alanine amidase [Streptomyces sp. NTH33]